MFIKINNYSPLQELSIQNVYNLMQQKYKEVSLTCLIQVSGCDIKYQCDYLDSLRIDLMSIQELQHLLSLTSLLTVTIEKEKTFKRIASNMAKTRLQMYEQEKQRPILYPSFQKKEKNTEQPPRRVPSLWEFYSTLVLDIEKPSSENLEETVDKAFSEELIQEQSELLWDYKVNQSLLARKKKQ